MKNTLQFDYLKEKWEEKHKIVQENLWKKHGETLNWFAENTRNLALGSMSSVLLLSGPQGLRIAPPLSVIPQEKFISIEHTTFFISDLYKSLPQEVRELTVDEERSITDIVTRTFGFKVAAEYENIRLNRNYGYIGAEQHLARYPGDTIDSHFESFEDRGKYYSSGMAPGLGAWGYFARSREVMTEEDMQKEKYYIAVPTFLSPGFAEHTGKYINFFHFRKMLVINPQNGKAIVAVIGDAGPAEYTGKHIGGSPEVMQYLERVDGAQKGAVLYFFIDDKENKVSLGPVELKNKTKLIERTFKKD